MMRTLAKTDCGVAAQCKYDNSKRGVVDTSVFAKIAYRKVIRVQNLEGPISGVAFFFAKPVISGNTTWLSSVTGGPSLRRASFFYRARNW